jgi:uncharacterized HAD superfamily protein
MRIAIDIDSTLHHYWNVLSESSKRRFGVELPYDEQVQWGITRLKPKQLEVCIADTHRDEAILAAEPYEGAVDVVRRWHGAGHFIQVTSHRDTECHPATARWLERIGLPYDELWCSFDKLARCRELSIDVLIDDSPLNLQRALEHGIRAATILHPWNADVCETEEVLAARDWPELERLITPILTG